MKKLLLISYYFPPCGGAPVQRWHRLLPHLVKAGWDVSVITADGADYPFLDETLLEDLSPSISVYRTKAPALSKLWRFLFGNKAKLPHGSLTVGKDSPLLQRLLIWVRLNLIIPDIRIFWMPSAYRKARQIIRDQGIKTVITTGPPHSTHLAGIRLKKAFNLRWIADWRDPWTGVYYLQLNPPTLMGRALHRHLEKKVCKTADLNLVISQHLMENLPEGKKTLLRNGFDEQAVARAKDMSLTHDKGDFTISYIGQVTEGQDLAVLAKIVRPFADKPGFKLSFVGSQLNDAQRQLLTEALGDKWELIPFVSHQEALGKMASSQVLVVLINHYPGFEGMITTKLYEYLAMEAPILAIGPRGSEAEILIDKYQGGICVDEGQIEEAQEWLNHQYQQSMAGLPYLEKQDASELSSDFQSQLLLKMLNS